MHLYMFAFTKAGSQKNRYTQRNLIESTRNQIVFNIFRLIWYQTDVQLVPNQSENSKYNLISGWFNKTSKRFFCVYLSGIAHSLSVPLKIIYKWCYIFVRYIICVIKIMIYICHFCEYFCFTQYNRSHIMYINIWKYIVYVINSEKKNLNIWYIHI